MVPYGQMRKSLPKEVVKERLREKKKLSKKLLKAKRARLVVKNLPFTATDENLKEYFGQYGEIKNVDLLKKSDGKLVGCAFIQFDLVQKAAKARHHTNGKEFMGRQISVDFSKAQSKYQKQKKEVRIENNTDEVIEIKEEDEEFSKSESDEEGDSYNESLKSDDEDDVAVDTKILPKNEAKITYFSNDLVEEKTIFIKNVPFDATNEDLRECMLQFGPLYYALICIDKLTEHSKGTAFVKFVNKEDADKALGAGTELKLLGNILDCHKALDREDVGKRNQGIHDKKKEPKDSRNLYLVREGVILAGTKAAEGITATDMAKRLQIEQYKTQMLRNLNMFVSRERLVVHNIPPSWDDKKLRILLQKYSGPGAVIREARIMRDMKNLDPKGVGKSKEYGFVSFTKHENALTALRSLNNNPDIFGAHRRPIITFSIENKTMVTARQKRLEKSRLYNPTNKNFKGSSKYEKKEDRPKKISRKQKPLKDAPPRDDENVSQFSGITAKAGIQQKMRSRYKLTTQAKLHHENLKKEKKIAKNAKKTLAERKREFIKQPKQKMNKISESDSFSKLVNEYKNKLVNVPTVKKSKWYE
ncbi:unnamed protein product [Phaedon cochleariae]|uniref:RRM domain-containing protein n=1 Tax=Phaedon cochleariae TaxID=80249 RepID=A0A9P0DNK1_PHACE|nr:unnamed protein product [Phaedon cochleariae]